VDVVVLVVVVVVLVVLVLVVSVLVPVVVVVLVLVVGGEGIAGCVAADSGGAPASDGSARPPTTPSVNATRFPRLPTRALYGLRWTVCREDELLACVATLRCPYG
jgi:hypothetical protein